jgi:hypothetical protein
MKMIEMKIDMRLIAFSVAAIIAVCATSAADAAPRKKRVTPAPTVQTYPGPGSTAITSREETGRTRTKVLVQKRSYLDGGTEVMPGGIQSDQSNFIGSFSFNPARSAVPNDSVAPSRPINDPFFLPGKNNPFFN